MIRTKSRYLRLAAAGLAGNAPRTWSTAAEFLRGSSDPRCGIRCYRRGDPRFRAYVRRAALERTIRALGLQRGEYYVSKTIPPGEVRISGELSWVGGEWVFHYSSIRAPMREALAQGGRHARGYFAVWGLLAKYCTPQDLEELRDVFDLYSPQGEYPVIELTVTRSDCGIFAHRNVLIWEIRHY